MWSLFAVTVLAEIAILYLPGFLILKALRLNGFMSLALAPIISIAAYVTLGIVFDKTSIFASWTTMFLPLLVAGLVVFLVSLLLKKKSDQKSSKTKQGTNTIWSFVVLYLVFGCLVAGYYFILPLNGAGSFGQGPDNAPHLSFIQAFLDAGNYSSLNSSYYHGIDNSYQDPSGNNGTGGFYPTGWHSVAALAGSLTGANAAVSANASLFVFLAIVLPINVFYLIQVLAKDNKALIALGSLVCLGFGAFPWGLITFGPLYPNFVAFVFVPLLVGTFALIFTSGSHIGAKIILSILFVLGLFDLIFLQSNAAFTVGVFLIPFCIGAIWGALSNTKSTMLSRRSFKLFSCAVFLIVCFFVWNFAYGLPIMSGVVSYPWPPYGSLRQEIVNILLLSYRDSAAQPILGLLVLFGIGYLLHKKQNRWLIGTYALTCLMCIIAATGTDDFRSFWIGFWYTDSYRIAAMAAIAAIPLAVYGVYVLYKLVMRIWDQITDWASLKRFSLKSKSIVFSIALVGVLFYPSFTIFGVGNITTALGEFKTNWFNTNNNIGNCVLDHDEQEFLTDVKSIVGDDLVINKPDDGSVFAYGGEGIDVFYKRTGIEAYETDSMESQLFRDSLVEYSTNKDVQDAVEKTGAKYLLLLDQNVDDESQERYWFDHYYESLWKGMDAVNDNTPGFKVVLAEGDMRLYEIEPVS